MIQESAMRPIDGPISNARARIADMDREGITMQAISCVPFLMYPDVDADLWARDRASQQRRDGGFLAEGDPAHFVPLASVPIQNPAAAARELERAAKLGLRGVEIPPKVIDRQLDESDFEIFGKRRRRSGWRFASIHLKPRRAEHFPDSFSATLVGNLYDTGLAAAATGFYGGVLERPSEPARRSLSRRRSAACAGRGDSTWDIGSSRNAAAPFPRPPSTYVAQFYFDIIAHNREMPRPPCEDLRCRSLRSWQRLSTTGWSRSSRGRSKQLLASTQRMRQRY